MADSDTLTATEQSTSLDTPWNVIVHDDPVNLMGYVTWVFMKVLALSEAQAHTHMLEVHKLGKSVVWTGNRERAEHYTHQLQAHQLTTTLEKAT